MVRNANHIKSKSCSKTVGTGVGSAVGAAVGIGVGAAVGTFETLPSSPLDEFIGSQIQTISTMPCWPNGYIIEILKLGQVLINAVKACRMLPSLATVFATIVNICQMLARMMWHSVFKVQTSKSLHTLVTTHVANVLFLPTLSKIVACRLGSQDVCEIFEFGAVQKCEDA